MKANGIASQPKEGGGLGLFVALVAILIIAVGATVVIDYSNESVAEYYEEEDFMYEVNGNEAVLMGFINGKFAAELKIPATIKDNTCKVVGIGPNAFQMIPITSVEIGENVITIGDGAFAMTTITSVEIGENVKTIGNNAFIMCMGLTELTIPEGVTDIGVQAFGQCVGIESLTIPSTVESIGSSAFGMCTKLSSIAYNAKEATLGDASVFLNAGQAATDGLTVTFGASVESIPNTILPENTYLKAIEIGKNVTSIGDSAFTKCSGLKELTIPNSVTSIGGSAFGNCSGVETLTISGTEVSIGDGAFAGCTKISSIAYDIKNTTAVYTVFMDVGKEAANGFAVKFGNSVESIPERLFAENRYLRTIEIGENVKTIEKKAFAVCSGVETLTISGTEVSIGDGAFAGCTKISSIAYDIKNTTLGNDVFENVGKEATNGFTVKFGNSVESIPLGIFWKNTNLRAIEIGENVKTIGVQAFEYCTKISYIEYNAIEADLGGKDNLVFHDVGKEATNGFTVKFGDSVESVPDYIFYQNSYLKEISLGKKVTSIGHSAFFECYGLTGTLAIPEGVTNIKDQAFQKCSGITGTLAIPEGVTNIGYQTFAACSGIAALTIPKSVTSIGVGAFAECTKISLIEYDVINLNLTGNEAIFDNVGSGATDGLTVNFGNSVESISLGLFATNASLKTISIGENVTSIGQSAFYNCSGLTGPLTIPDKVTNIGMEAFNGCKYTSITIPDSVETIDVVAFGNNDSLKNVIIGSGIKTIGNFAFYGCSAIEKVEFKTLLNTISVGSYVFHTGSTEYEFVNFDNPPIKFTENTAKDGLFNDHTYELKDTAGTLEMDHYVVTLDANDGECSKETINTDKNGKITEALPTPTREGYTFDGWYLNGEKVTQDTVFGKNSTVTAKWNAQYTITFDANDGECSVKTMKTNAEGKIDGTIPTPTREGYTFDGWYLDGKKVTQDTVFTSNATVTAQWTAVPEPEPEKKTGNDLNIALLIVLVLAVLGTLYVALRRN